MKNKHENTVADFFDTLAANYSSRYSESRPFLRFFHRQRMEAALRVLTATSGKVWDIGAGTGVLGKALVIRAPETKYFASDISREMQRVSGLPTARYFHGSAREAPARFRGFSAVFMLGVTTYMSRSDLSELLHRTLPARLQPDGQLILTFTHREGLDWRLRRPLRGFLRLLRRNKYIAGQDFSVRAYSLAEAEALMRPHFTVSKVIFLNHTLPFLNRLFPRMSVRLAHRIFASESDFLQSFLSSDFLISAVRTDSPPLSE